VKGLQSMDGHHSWWDISSDTDDGEVFPSSNSVSVLCAICTRAHLSHCVRVGYMYMYTCDLVL